MRGALQATLTTMFHEVKSIGGARCANTPKPSRSVPGASSCEKPNVVRETSGMMEEVAKEVARTYPGIALWSTNIDAQLMWLNKNPEDYNVIVSSNLFGDILSDALAGLVGGLGFAASGNIGDEVAVFEPTHASAPKYAELDPPIVNPPIRLAVCVSGEGTTLQNLIDQVQARRLKAEIVQVVASRPRIGAIARAEAARIPLALANRNARSRTEFSASVF